MNYNKNYENKDFNNKDYNIEEVIFLFKAMHELSKLEREKKKKKLEELIKYIIYKYPNIYKDEIEKILIIFEIENIKRYFNKLEKIENKSDLMFYLDKLQKTYVPEIYFIKTKGGLSIAYFNEIYEKVKENILKNKEIEISEISEEYKELLDYLLLNKELIEIEIERLFNLPGYYMIELYEIIYPSEFLIESEEEYREYLNLMQYYDNLEEENNET